MTWNKMSGDELYIRKLATKLFETIDIIKGTHRRGMEGYFISNIQYDLDSYSEDCISDYVRMYGYASLGELKSSHPDCPELYIAEAIATVSSSFNRDGDMFFEDIEDAREYIRRRWLITDGLGRKK